VLIAGHTIQGAAAAVMVPQVLTTYRAIFTGKERGAVFGLYGAVGGLATALGLLLGGLLGPGAALVPGDPYRFLPGEPRTGGERLPGRCHA
jgi:MFS family permease